MTQHINSLSERIKIETNTTERFEGQPFLVIYDDPTPRGYSNVASMLIDEGTRQWLLEQLQQSDNWEPSCWEKSNMINILAYERIDESALRDAIRLTPPEKLLVRQPFRWFLDGQVLSNAYEMFEMDSICEERGLEILERYGDHIAIVRHTDHTSEKTE